LYENDLFSDVRWDVFIEKPNETVNKLLILICISCYIFAHQM